MSQSERAKPEKDEQAGPAGLGEAAGTAGQEGRAPSVIGVVGAGTMGSGIAQLAARSGARALLYDPIAGALERGGARARAGLGKEAEKRRLSEEHARAAADRRRALLAARPRRRAGGRRGDGQDGHPRKRWAGLPRQPLQPPVRTGGAAAAGGAACGGGDDRPHLPPGGGLSHGPV